MCGPVPDDPGPVPGLLPDRSSVVYSLLSLQSIESSIGGNVYQHSRVNQWTTAVMEQCLHQLSKLGKPFKYIGTVTIRLVPQLQ